MAPREFKYPDAKSHKFWKVEVQGSDVVTYYCYPVSANRRHWS